MFSRWNINSISTGCQNRWRYYFFQIFNLQLVFGYTSMQWKSKELLELYITIFTMTPGTAGAEYNSCMDLGMRAKLIIVEYFNSIQHEILRFCLNPPPPFSNSLKRLYHVILVRFKVSCSFCFYIEYQINVIILNVLK